MSDHKLVSLSRSLLDKLSVVHLRLQRVLPYDFKAGEIVILPSHSLVDVSEVFD